MGIRLTVVALVASWLGAALLLAGCSTIRPLARPSTLQGREFILQSAEGVELLAGVDMRLGFSRHAVMVGGGCNFGTGTYKMKSGRLVLTSLMATQRGCSEREEERDHWLRVFFSSQPRVELVGTTLRLSDGKVHLAFLDRIEADPDRPLQGTQWEVSVYVDGEAAMGLLGITSPRLVFLDDGAFTLRASCREGRGTYEVVEVPGSARQQKQGGRIRIDNVSFSEGPCAADKDRAAAEFAESVLKVGELEHHIKGRSLRLTGEERGLWLNAAE